MLPFLKHKESGASSPIESIKRKQDDTSDIDPVHVAAEELIKAIHTRDIAAVAEALKAAFEIMDSQPHMEGPHE